MVAGRRLEIQWLRAIAAIEVVFAHSDLITKHFSDFSLSKAWWYQPFAGIGVELFFILSGYVICMRAPSYSSGREFIVSRILRLAPMYWVFTTLVLITFFINPAWRLNNFEMGFWPLAQSYLILPQYGFPLLGVGWTLEHEMVFYWSVAIVMMCFGLSSKSMFGIAWLLTGMGLLGCLQGKEPGYSLWSFHLFTPYMFAFAFGWLLRCVEDVSPSQRRNALLLFLAIALAGLVFGSEFGDRLVIRIALVGVLFYAFLHWRRYFEADTTFNRVGHYLGDASFSIYLCHWFILSAAGKVLGVLDPPAVLAEPIRLIGVAVSSAIGVLIFILMEKPVDRWLRGKGGPSKPLWKVISLPAWLNVSRLFTKPQ